MSAVFKLKTWLRGARFLAHILSASEPRGQRQQAAQWLHQVAKQSLLDIQLETSISGRPPAKGLIVSNHISYLDIPSFASVTPMIFMAKREVANWPIIGKIATRGGTLYVNRESKQDVHPLNLAMEEVMNGDVPLVLFPEGTSSDGESVLPFFSALFAPAARNGWPVTPAAIAYHAEGARVQTDIAYWGDMTFLPHFVRLLGIKKIRAHIVFGETFPAALDRKELARNARQAVILLQKQARAALAA